MVSTPNKRFKNVQETHLLTQTHSLFFDVRPLRVNEAQPKGGGDGGGDRSGSSGGRDAYSGGGGYGGGGDVRGFCSMQLCGVMGMDTLLVWLESDRISLNVLHKKGNFSS
jgi:uncharacterized membrane protein